MTSQRISFISLFLIIALQSLATEKTSVLVKQSFPSQQQEGLIGITEVLPIDNPADNIFHIVIDTELCAEDKVWLVYELDGVQDHTAVSRSINDQFAIGGYLVKKRRGWALQREELNATWLKQGDNTIRFTLPATANHSYRVKNLRVEVEKGAINNSTETQIVFNRPSELHYQNKAYVKGFVRGDVAAVRIDGRNILFNGDVFESLIDLKQIESNCSVDVEVVGVDGSSYCHAIVFSELANADYVFTRDGLYYQIEDFFTNKTQQSIELRGARLTTEEGSLQAPSFLSITTLRDVDIPALDAGMVNVTAGHQAFRFLPNGTQFGKEIKLTIPFDTNQIPDGYTEQDIKSYYFDEQNHHWVAVPTDTVMLESGLIVSKTNHFTDYINAIIKVPESPEVEAYNSTSMKGIKAANPTAAVNLINPPQANNTGSASLGYPINIPAGRAGMQPQLGINYNSGGGNGWMGLGWNLTIPSISIDTRWGVPRYDATKETETYTLNGEQLSPLAHRDEFQPRVTGKKQFYPRVEGSFNRIERFGSSPADYYWIVTDKSGTKYFYGSVGASVSGNLDKSAVLRTNEKDDNGNIAIWCLREIRDLNGNTVKYHYTKVEDKGLINGTVSGYQIYIDKITYTGYNGSDGKYAVIFKRDRQLNEGKRKDISILANFGFKQVTADLLRKIEIQFEGNNIRSYELEYKQGEFYKTLLSSIREFDAAGDFFNQHVFDYYNDVKNGTGVAPFKGTENWNIPSDGVDGGLLVSKAGFDDKASALSGNKSNEFGFGMTVTVGLPDGKYFSKSNSIGGSFGFSQSDTEGKLIMIDMNGDGLPDKVITDDNGFRYRPNLSKPGMMPLFGEEIAMNNLGEFYRERSKTFNAGFEAQGGFGDDFSAFVGLGGSKTTSVTSVYFTDVNGDQLPDLVKNGLVYFNHLNTETGVITFLPSSAGTPSPVATGSGVAGDIFETDPAELEEDITKNPLHDIVRLWRAPENGRIKISGQVQLVNTGLVAPNADGVSVSIQQNSSVPLWKQRINANDFIAYTPTGVNDVVVNKGDRIYFRVQSIFNGEHDEVKWSPVIKYIDKDTLIVNANSRPVYKFDAERDFVLSAPAEIGTPIAGRIRLESTFEKPITTDDVKVEVIHRKALGDITIYQRQFTWNEKVNEPVELQVNVEADESFVFKVTSSTNVDWPTIRWRPYLYYTESFDPAVTELVRDGKPTIAYYGIPQLSIFAKSLKETRHWKVTEEVDTLEIVPQISFPTITFPNLNPYSGDLMFSVKKKDTLVFKKLLNVQQGNLTLAGNFKIAVAKDDSLYFEFHTPNEKFAEELLSQSVKIMLAEKDSVVDAGLFTRFEKEPDIIYGSLYRQWGQFAYNGNRTRADEPIREGDLKLSESLKKNYKSGDVGSTDDLKSSGAYDPAADNFIMLYARGTDATWAGYDQYVFVDGVRMSSSRMGDDDLMPLAPFEGGGATARAINKITKSLSGSLSGGVSVGEFSGVSGSANGSIGSSRVLSDFMDMNGDRYPDIITEKGIQYTQPTGALESSFATFVTGNVQETSTLSRGVSVGGFVKSDPKNGTVNQQSVKNILANAKVSGTINGNYGKGDNKGKFMWQDINADGLPDKVHADGFVELNLGYSLAAPEKWDHSTIMTSESTSSGAGLGFSKGVGSESSSIAGGIGLSRSDNETARSLMDINGDGLADEVSLGGSVWENGLVQGVRVRLNTGNGFVSAMDWPGAPKINESSTTGESANLAFTVCIPIPPVLTVVKLCFNPSGNIGRSMSRDEARISDVDGDGFPDYLVSENDGQLSVKRSTIGRTNMLKEVTRPLGATFTLNYHREGNTYNLPNSQWVLDEVKMFDGFSEDGIDTMLTTYAYENGYYDRHEREFYGFEKVISRTHDTSKDEKPVYTAVTQTFNNNDYFKKGLMLSEVMTDGAGNKYVEKENEYVLNDVRAGVKFPALAKTEQKFFEGQSTAGKSTSMTYQYDAIGNVVFYTDKGDEGDEDDLNATISYHDIDALYIKGTPKSIVVYGGSGSLAGGQGAWLRKRETTMDPATGDIKQIKQYLSESDISLHDMEYDTYGNLSKIIRPANSKGQRMVFNYEYDPTVFIYTTKVSNSYGYSSTAEYDLRYGQVLKSTDLNGNEITYELDALGRVKNITGPYEKGGANKTIEFEYHPEASIPWALTNHYDPANPKNKMQTSIFVDGLGRVLQTKKDAAIYDGEGKADKEVMVVSGRITFDAFGRTISALYPVTEPIGTPGNLNYDKDAQNPTTTEYDVLNRTLKVTLPDGVVTTTAYGFESDRNNKKQFSTKTTDANGKQTEQFTDVRGRVTAVKNYTSSDPVWTSFKYNAINEQIEAMDDLGHTTFSKYDNFGRRIERKHPDAGITQYSYDLAGNLTELVTANLATEGGVITYNYDFERLTEITYPQNPENNVKYTYGDMGSTDNRAGRIVTLEDASGAQEFFYGPLGEVVKNIRTVVIPQHDEQTYTTEWVYDTWNRLTSMTYADGEKVDYVYNVGGLLRSMSGKKKNENFAYVNQLGYDKFEQRVFLAYGNGTKTTYAYEEDRRRLKNMTAQTAAKRLFMDNAYEYDKVNNILSLKNNAAIPSANLMGGTSEYSYSYDDLYRLTSAQGSYKGANDEHTYTLAMSYNSVGGITKKVQSHQRKGQEQKKTTYNLKYTYGEEQPHAPIHIGENAYSYDANGNQTGWTNDVSGQRRQLMWDEENRIRAIQDNGSIYHYIYDASGERVLKGKSTGQRVFVNGEWKAGSGGMGNYTVYVNPYLVLKSGGYTKHYYIEGQRIVSKLGSGIDGNGKGPLKAGGSDIDYAAKGQRIFDGIVKNLKFLGADGQILTAGKSGKVPPGQVKGGSTSTAESFRYFYHPDHLGSTSYITDASGEVYQHLEYFAFGETFVEEHSNTERTPYLFSGKELDEETGLYYYGARYYDAKTSIWLSVDPQADSYIRWSPFVFSFNNPINFEDPDGESPISIFAKQVAKAGIKKAAKEFVEAQIKSRLSSYMSKKWARQLADDALTAIDLATSQSWWEYAIEVIPIAGDAYGGYKLTEQGIKVWKLVERFENRAQAVAKSLSNLGGLRRALGISDKALEAHHIIPTQLLKENKVVQDAVAAGFDFNGVVNGIAVKAGHGPHSKYTDQLRSRIDEWAAQNPNFTPEQAKDFITDLSGQAKRILGEQSGKKVNGVILE